jgi:hypothetical protein
MLKRKVSCTFKRKNTLEIKERIYPLNISTTKYRARSEPTF